MHHYLQLEAKNVIEKLQKCQKKVLRFINGTRLIDHIPNIFLHMKFQQTNYYSLSTPRACEH